MMKRKAFRFKCLKTNEFTFNPQQEAQFATCGGLQGKRVKNQSKGNLSRETLSLNLSFSSL